MCARAHVCVCARACLSVCVRACVCARAGVPHVMGACVERGRDWGSLCLLSARARVGFLGVRQCREWGVCWCCTCAISGRGMRTEGSAKTHRTRASEHSSEHSCLFSHSRMVKAGNGGMTRGNNDTNAMKTWLAWLCVQGQGLGRPIRPVQPILHELGE